ncbi:hypothetical protein BH23GEM8_BH23GEM8_18980 [soil metagenome]
MSKRFSFLPLLLLLTVSACDATRGGGAPPLAGDLPGVTEENRVTPRARRVTGSFPLASAGFPKGDSAAAITIYEISDYGCRYCGVFAREEFPALSRDFVDSGRVRWVFIPTEGASVNGAEAARAAVCAGQQDRFWEMHHLLFSDQRAWMRPRNPEPILTQLAAAVGVEVVAFSTCYGGDAARRRLQQSSRLSLLLGIRATPSFFVDGRIVEGALRAAQFAELIGRVEAAISRETGPAE